MKEFKISDRIRVECEFKKARDGFNHKAVLYVDGNVKGRAKIHYINRTWESYEFQSVLHEVVGKAKGLTAEERAEAQAWIANHKDEDAFKSLLMVTKIGDILCNTQAEKNTWKKRMMKASLGEAVSFPPDWDQLPEDEKERRLAGALDQLK